MTTLCGCGRPKKHDAAICIVCHRATWRTKEERFWARVQKSDGCWLWTGYHADTGYGNLDGEGVHRFAWRLHFGPIPVGYTIGHACHDRAVRLQQCEGGLVCLHRICVRPDHLALQTYVDNNAASLSPSALSARKTLCVRGHPLAGVNLIVHGGHRRCRQCARERRERKAA